MVPIRAMPLLFALSLTGCTLFEGKSAPAEVPLSRFERVRDVDDFACFTLTDGRRFRLFGLSLPVDPRRRLSVLEYLRSQKGREVDPWPALEGFPPAADMRVVVFEPTPAAAGEGEGGPVETRRSVAEVLVAADPSLLSQEDLANPAAPPALVRLLREAADPVLRAAAQAERAAAQPARDAAQTSARRPGRE